VNQGERYFQDVIDDFARAHGLSAKVDRRAGGLSVEFLQPPGPDKLRLPFLHYKLSWPELDRFHSWDKVTVRALWEQEWARLGKKTVGNDAPSA
jgi:hypothetical protein